MKSSRLAFISFNVEPHVQHTYKYSKLGKLSVENHQAYCTKHKIDYIDKMVRDDTCDICWAKLPLILKTLEDYEWVLWADSDTLIANMNIDIRLLCDDNYDLISQCPVVFLFDLSWTKEKCMLEMPLNTGVFLIKQTERAKQLLKEAYKQRQRLFFNDVWNGIGEQEALIALLQKGDVQQPKVKYLPHLQCMPKSFSENSIFIHFYGNGATHLLSNSRALEIIASWTRAIELGTALPENRIQFHWSCIQNTQVNMVPDRGGLERFLYKDNDLC